MSSVTLQVTQDSIPTQHKEYLNRNKIKTTTEFRDFFSMIIFILIEKVFQ